MSDLINPPDAARLAEGMRDTGYSFHTAAADIIDNAIAAGAKRVEVRMDLDRDGRKHVWFGDDGAGMDEATLFAAMRYGAPRRPDPGSLGKFGLGLKTASSAICRCFTVISRTDGDGPLAKLAWDIDHVVESNSWEMLREAVTPDEQEAFEELCGDTGTLVIWSRCDRLLARAYRIPGGTSEKKAMDRLAEELREHVSLVYHRFLDAHDDRARDVVLSVDGESVAPWNPFLPARAEQMLPESQTTVRIGDDGSQLGTASVRAWILPHSKDLSDEEKAQARISNSGQGFYVFREDRLIHSGGWLGVFGPAEPHTSLLRVEFDFGHELDDAFNVDVKKSRIGLEPAFSEELQKLLNPARREAQMRYRRRSPGAVTGGSGPDHSGANRTIDDTRGTSGPEVTGADAATGTGTMDNHRGRGITIVTRVDSDVAGDRVHVEAVDDIVDGRLWEPALRSAGKEGHRTGVRLNSHHDFYRKIYAALVRDAEAIEALDLLFWALATAEFNCTDREIESVFEDLRDDVSGNLRKLLRSVPFPEETVDAPDPAG